MFADNVKKAMYAKGTTWKDTADALNIGQNQLYYWARNNTMPKKETIERLANYLDVTESYLIGLDDIKEEITKELENKYEPSYELTEQEKALIEMFRNASPENKLHIIHDIVEWSK